ncbi:hypothetical protein FOMPIDRAFT_1059392 [Fomitopsis schrenkii]|uniref:Uncharacterized protein n=1 Tax=Fomitopsis schrenkii TaxID=2126942 RepID=S8EFX6_FOMSC|nr:hypothetical protein FOMPIDRAFT_1059392 [Fomitopsis schrenkii]
MIVAHPQDVDTASVQHTGLLSDFIPNAKTHLMAPRGMNQVVSGGPGSIDGGDGGETHGNPLSSSGSSSAQGGQRASSSNNVATKIVIPVLVALALLLFIAVIIYFILRFRRGSQRRRQLARGLLPTTTEKPQLFEVQLESPPVVHSTDARWNHIKPLSAKYIPHDVYELEQAVAATLSSYPGTPAASRPVSMQTSSSHSSKGSRASKTGPDGGKLRVAVAIAMPSPRSSQFVEEKEKEMASSEDPPPLYLGVADLPWHAEKVEGSASEQLGASLGEITAVHKAVISRAELATEGIPQDDLVARLISDADNKDLWEKQLLGNQFALNMTSTGPNDKAGPAVLAGFKAYMIQDYLYATTSGITFQSERLPKAVSAIGTKDNLDKISAFCRYSKIALDRCRREQRLGDGSCGDHSSQYTIATKHLQGRKR